ncbi:Chloramphenicol acetyltransferase-like domain protein [Cordyceps fumosorosea ARSEF 2679]|uniref:Chloramphenicol acetyltransferase-like domain protein n=1 Tax=Cordyceps fumosorosea (strain ARSEF 2679) TaxID=1081104 RepID=A0A168EMJ5_CORFA|nr:Chloramphenicol acetyltransferase-like domain protein [Cordyceps fumosorosea ARSEF 2679]OAA73991.1 Chloramphenicol acetyltransferase-like domain protein [Cordyceps fumosorosea ARSEF 2679]
MCITNVILAVLQHILHGQRFCNVENGIYTRGNRRAAYTASVNKAVLPSMSTAMHPEDYTVVPIPLLNATVSNVELMSLTKPSLQARVSVIFNAPLSFEKLHSAWITALHARPIMQAPMRECPSAPSGLAYHVRTPTGMAKYLKRQDSLPEHLRDFCCLDESHRSIRSYCPGFGGAAASDDGGVVVISQGPEAADQKRCAALNAVDGFDQLRRSDRPQTTIQVTRFRDATLVTMSVNHAFGDLVTIKSFLKAWEAALHGREVRPYERVDADPFLGYEPGGELASGGGGLPPPPPPEGWKVYGLLDKARFMRRYLWDHYVQRPERSIEDRRIFLPDEFVAALQEKARYDLTFVQKRLDGEKLKPEGEDDGTTTKEKKERKKLYVSRSDVLYAWLLKHSHAHLPPDQPSTAVTISNGRFRPPAGLPADPASLADNDLLCGAMAIALPGLTAGRVAALPLGELALHVREGIRARTTPEGVKRWLNFQLAHGRWREPSGAVVAPCEPGDFVTGITDWRAVRLGEVDFSPARLPGEGAAVVKMSAVDGHMVVKSSRRDFYICLGDVEGGVWILGYASREQWRDPRSFGRYETLLREPRSKL